VLRSSVDEVHQLHHQVRELTERAEAPSPLVAASTQAWRQAKEVAAIKMKQAARTVDHVTSQVASTLRTTVSSAVVSVRGALNQLRPDPEEEVAQWARRGMPISWGSAQKWSEIHRAVQGGLSDVHTVAARAAAVVRDAVSAAESRAEAAVEAWRSGVSQAADSVKHMCMHSVLPLQDDMDSPCLAPFYNDARLSTAGDGVWRILQREWEECVTREEKQ
jgi:hypothetical protein